MKWNHISSVLGMSIAVLIFGCDGSDSKSSTIVVQGDMTVVARDARGGSMPPQDAGAPSVDAAPMVELDMAVVEPDMAVAEPDMAVVEPDMAVVEPDMPDPPECGPGVDTCVEACRWLADCALAGACELDATDRPLVVTMCERTCAQNGAYGDILCGHNSCEASIRFAQNDAQFAAICRGEDPPEMADPVIAQCTALNTCLGTCNSNQACVDQCYMNATPEAQQRFGNIINCLRANQCINRANQIDQVCLREQCGDELDRCFGPQAEPEGEGSCNLLLRCINECPDGDGNCRVRCINETSPESHQLYIDALNCVNDRCPDGDPECQQMNCGDEIDTCVDDGRPIGADTCSEIAECFWACRPGVNQAACRRDCNEEGTRESQNAWSDFLTCAGDAMCRDRPSCEAACQQQMAACRNAGEIQEDAGMPEPDAAPPVEDAGVPNDEDAGIVVEPAVDADVEPVEDAGVQAAADAGQAVPEAGADPVEPDPPAMPPEEEE